MSVPVVYVRWTDSVAWGPSWLPATAYQRKLRAYPPEHQTSGFLVDEHRDWVAVALSVNHDGTSWQQVQRIQRDSIVDGPHELRGGG